MFNAINIRHCMGFKTRFSRLPFFNLLLLKAYSPTFGPSSGHGPRVISTKNFVRILDSTTLAPHQVHRRLTHFIILVTGGLRETNIRITATTISRPYRNVRSFVHLALKHYVTETAFTSQYANTRFPNYEAASMLVQASRSTFVQLLRPPLWQRHTMKTGRTFEHTFICALLCDSHATATALNQRCQHRVHAITQSDVRLPTYAHKTDD